MPKPDQAHQWTDKELAALERRIARVYREAWDDLEKTVIDYFNRFLERDEEMKKLIGTEINGKIWTERDYELWRLNQIGRGERFDDLAVKVAERYTKANEVALAYVNDATPGIYSLNRNYAAYTIEKVSGNVGFTLWDEATVKRLIVERPDLMPYYPKKKALKRGIDLKWGKKQITKSVAGGLLQGKSVGKIATDLQARVFEMNRASAVRAARTAVTGAQNAGRMDSYAFYSVDVWMKSLSTLLVAVVTFAVLFVLAWRSGRTYCNTICPVGTVLGFLARYSLFKPRFDTSKCNGCKLCARNCKASCIDPAAHKIDYSRCVACMDCLENCRQGAITYTLRRRKPDPAPAPQRPAADAAKTPSDASRRRFLGLAGIVAQTRQDRTSTVIPGVAIATALIPPLCTAGFGLATGQIRFFFGAFYLFFINSVFIALATYAMVRFLQYEKKVFIDKVRERTVKRLMMVITLVTFIPSVVIGFHMVRVSLFEAVADKYVSQVFNFPHTRVIECNKHYAQGKNPSQIELLLVGGEPLGEEVIENARTQMRNFGLEEAELVVRQANTEDKVDVVSLQKSYQELLEEKNRRIGEMSSQLKRYRVTNVEVNDISREVGAMMDNIGAISLTKGITFDVEGTPGDTTLVCVVTPRDSALPVDRETLIRWLRIRTKVENVKLFVEP